MTHFAVWQHARLLVFHAIAADIVPLHLQDDDDDEDDDEDMTPAAHAKAVVKAKAEAADDDEDDDDDEEEDDEVRAAPAHLISVYLPCTCAGLLCYDRQHDGR